MKILYLLLFSLLLPVIPGLAQQAEMFQTYVIVNVDSRDDEYRAGGINAERAPAFNGSVYNPATTSIILKGAQIKTFKNNGGDVTGARLYYRVYPASVTPSREPFILLTIPFATNLNGSGDQAWSTISANINLANGLTPGAYTLEVYWQITTNLGDRFDSNGGNNYKATFTVLSTTLPVALASFNVKASGLMASLEWATASETDNASFEVQRSADAKTFAAIGRVAGRGTSLTRQQYSFTDETPVAGANYYRLKQVDKSGVFSYSPIRAVLIRTNGELTILGNPAATDLNVAGLIPGSTAELFDMAGQRRHQQFVTTDRMQVDVRSLQTGTYLLRIVEPTGVQTKRVLIAR